MRRNTLWVLVALALAMLLLLFAVGMAGTTLAGSTFLFYIFWELMLVASCALIAIWGEGERRGAVALKSCTAAVAP